MVGGSNVLATSFGFVVSFVKFRLLSRAWSRCDEVACESRCGANRFRLSHLDAFEDGGFV
jgi:hypothetical protein